MSALRNMFLTSSIAVGMVGFGDKFNDTNKILIKTIALGIIILSISFGLKATNDFSLMIQKNSEIKNLSPVEKELLKQAKEWPLFAYTYITFLSIIIFAYVGKQFKQLSK
jgi:hypothetical protein